VACVQETRWKGSGCRFIGCVGKTYSGVGRDEKTEGVGICAAQLRSIKLINRVTGLLSDGLENVFSVYVHFLHSSATVG